MNDTMDGSIDSSRKESLKEYADRINKELAKALNDRDNILFDMGRNDALGKVREWLESLSSIYAPLEPDLIKRLLIMFDEWRENAMSKK